MDPFYSWTTDGPAVTVEWSAAGLPAFAWLLALAGIAGGAWLLRRARRGGAPWTRPAGWAAAGAGLLMAAGAVLLPAPRPAWTVDAAGVRVRAGGAEIAADWSEVTGSRLERGGASLPRAALVIETTAGDVRLMLGWLAPFHRRALVEAIAGFSPAAAAAATGDPDYLASLERGEERERLAK